MATVRECTKKLNYAVQQGRIDIAAGFKPVGQHHHPSDHFLDDTMFGFERLDRIWITHLTSIMLAAESVLPGRHPGASLNQSISSPFVKLTAGPD